MKKVYSAFFLLLLSRKNWIILFCCSHRDFTTICSSHPLLPFSSTNDCSCLLLSCRDVFPLPPQFASGKLSCGVICNHPPRLPFSVALAEEGGGWRTPIRSSSSSSFHRRGIKGSQKREGRGELKTEGGRRRGKEEEGSVETIGGGSYHCGVEGGRRSY